MTLPQFNAEASLYKTRGSYRTSAGHPNSAGRQTVVPQLRANCDQFDALRQYYEGIGEYGWAEFFRAAYDGCMTAGMHP